MNLSHYPAGWENLVWYDPWAHEWFEIKEGWPRRWKNIFFTLKDADKAAEHPIEVICDAFYD